MPGPEESAPGVPRITVHPRPLSGMTPGPPDPWTVTSTQPAARPTTQPDPWSVKQTAPAPAAEDKSWAVMLTEPITDIPKEIGAAASEAGSAINKGLNPLASQGQPLKGAWEQFKDVGSGLAAIPSLAMSPLTGASRSAIGHPYSDITGIPYDKAKDAVDMAISAAAPRGALPRAPTIKGSTLEKIFSPDTVDANAKTAAATIRSASGGAARDTATTETAIEPFYKKIATLPEADRLNFLDYVEGRSSRYSGMSMADPQMQDLADTFRTAFEQRMTKLQALPSTSQVHFIEDYFPHFWKDPAAAQAFVKSFGGASRQGSGASLKARTMPTIADGIAAGLEPLTTDPLEATMRYVTSMDRFIAATEVLDIAKANGNVRFIKPKTMGASGHPDSFRVPDGWVALEGRGSTNATGGKAYAPEGFARVYNNWISRGFAEMGQEYGAAYDGVRRASNSITALELGMSGYHTLTMAQEAMVNQVASALAHARGGRVGLALRTAAKAPAAPIALPMKGKKLQDVYLGLTPGTQEMRDIVELLTQAGGRAKGMRHAPDYDFSRTGSYYTALKRGHLRLQMAADKAEIAGSPVKGSVKVAARHIGRIIDTVAQPIFEKYIPLLKNGAFYENMSSWLMKNPTATQEQKIQAARQLWDSVDNRFGEMVGDNVFWNQVLKQSAMVALRSWSWSFGGVVREIGGGVRDVARVPGKTTRLNDIMPNDARWTQKMDYVIALPITYAAIAATYQYLKTGEGPKDIQDVMAPRTGGMDAATGEPERVMIPGYMKDVYGFYEDPVREAKNKVASAPRMAWEVTNNQNWRGDPIFPPSGMEDAPNWLQAFWKYTTENVGPISVRDIMKGRKEGSELNFVEKTLGVRNAPRYLTDPDGFVQMLDNIKSRRWRNKEKYDRRQQGLYEE